ncbi:MAG: hypothetical protein V3U91_04580, partial [Candidatus Aminicenantaceae bacterium]
SVVIQNTTSPVLIEEFSIGLTTRKSPSRIKGRILQPLAWKRIDLPWLKMSLLNPNKSASLK